MICLVVTSLFGSLAATNAMSVSPVERSVAVTASDHHAVDPADECCEPVRSHGPHCHADVWANFGCASVKFERGGDVVDPSAPATGHGSVVSGILDPPKA